MLEMAHSETCRMVYLLSVSEGYRVDIRANERDFPLPVAATHALVVQSIA